MGSVIPKRIVKGVLERDNQECVISGPDCVGVATVADHRVNRGSGGSKVLDDPRNLVASCGICNGWKETATGKWLVILRERGVRVEKAATNQESLSRAIERPVAYPDGRKFFLLPGFLREEIVEVPF